MRKDVIKSSKKHSILEEATVSKMETVQPEQDRIPNRNVSKMSTKTFLNSWTRWNI